MMRSPAATALAAVVLTCVPVLARADMTKEQCIEANGQGQELRHGNKLSAARAQLLRCADPSCPALVRDDCTKRLDEVERMQPTIVFVAKDGAGQDLTAVKVTVDGEPLTDKLDGSELRVDPGAHTFTFAVQGLKPVNKTLVLAPGEKDRRESIVVGAPAAPAGAPGAASAPARLVVTTDARATVSVDGKVVAEGRFDGAETQGPHQVSVTASGMRPYQADVDLREGETRTLDVTLEQDKKGAAVWPWIAGGAAVVVGAAIGGYFLFKPSDQTLPVPAGRTAALQLATWRLP
jgi:hypothetical protein